MIPSNDIIEWSEFAPWKSNEQVEQDLVISRSLVELFSDNVIQQNLEFLADTSILLHPSENYDPEASYKKVKDLLLLKM